MLLRNVLALLAPAAVSLCVGGAAAADVAPAPAETALHVDWLDPSVSPAEDFFRHANGGWQDRNPIPPEEARWSVFDVVHRRTEDVLHGIL
jgi:putative endopeptidase